MGIIKDFNKYVNTIRDKDSGDFISKLPDLRETKPYYTSDDIDVVLRAISSILNKNRLKDIFTNSIGIYFDDLVTEIKDTNNIDSISLLSHLRDTAYSLGRYCQAFSIWKLSGRSILDKYILEIHINPSDFIMYKKIGEIYHNNNKEFEKINNHICDVFNSNEIKCDKEEVECSHSCKNCNSCKDKKELTINNCLKGDGCTKLCGSCPAAEDVCLCSVCADIGKVGCCMCDDCPNIKYCISSKCAFCDDETCNDEYQKVFENDSRDEVYDDEDSFIKSMSDLLSNIVKAKVDTNISIRIKDDDCIINISSPDEDKKSK